MFNIILPCLLFIGILIWICIRLKNWKQRLIFLLALVVGIPVLMYYGFKWGWKTREQNLLKAQVECRQRSVADGLHLIFSGYTERDLSKNCFTIHRNSGGQPLDSNKQQVDTVRFHNGVFSADYYYNLPMETSDILQIRVGEKEYTLSNFVLTASANYNMGGAVVSGCRIDSADINNKRVAFAQNMIIHKTDDY